MIRSNCKRLYLPLTVPLLERLCPALLGFGAFTRSTRSTPAPTHIERARLVELATKEKEKEQATRRIAIRLRHEVNMRRLRLPESFRNLPARAAVLVYRTVIKTYKELFKFI